MKFIPLTDLDWSKMKKQWQAHSAALSEDFSTFAVGTFGALDAVAAGQNSGLYGLECEGEIDAFCQANRLLVKEYSQPVLRVRFITVAPKYDFGIAGLAQYAQVLVQILSGVVWLSQGQLPAHRIRFHLRSPADAQFFAGLQMGVLQGNPFSEFSIKGAWLECRLK